MASANPYTPPRAAVADIEDQAQRFSEPKVWPASGRLGRLRYMAYLMVGYLVVIAAGVVGGLLAAVTNSPFIVLVLIALVGIPYFVLSILVLIQRTHDMGWSGWAALLTLIPFVAFIWLFKAGTPGENPYGNPPPPNPTSVKIFGWMMPVGVLLIGILAAVALPAYQGYVMRAKAAQIQQQP